MKPGDIVQLKSGGPAMTVKQVVSDGGGAYCVWFHDGEMRQGLFFLETLQEVPRATNKPG